MGKATEDMWYSVTSKASRARTSRKVTSSIIRRQ